MSKLLIAIISFILGGSFVLILDSCVRIGKERKK